MSKTTSVRAAVIGNRSVRGVISTVLISLLAGVGAIAGSFGAVGFTRSFLASPIASFLTDTLPAALVNFAINTLTNVGRDFGISHFGQKMNLLLAITIAVVVVGVLSGIALAVGKRLASPSVSVVLTALLTGVFGFLLAGPLSALGAAIGSAIVIAVGSLLAAPRVGNAGVSGGRRELLGSIASGFGVVFLGYFLGNGRGQSSTQKLSSLRGSNATGNETGGQSGGNAPSIRSMLDTAEERSLDVDGIEGLVSDDFYQVDINSANPSVATENWNLTVTGANVEDRAFSYEEITGMETERRFVSLRCVSDNLNGDSMDNALWTGVSISNLLDLPENCCVRLRAADDYYQVFPREALENGFLAYGLNERKLPKGHGAPVRVLIPGHWGEINVKWLTEIEVLEEDAEGYWEKRGWHGTGPVNTVAKLHATNRLGAGKIQVAGHAYAGTRGIQKVEVSTDGGNSWSKAKLSERLPAGTGENGQYAEDAWRQWVYTYDSPGENHEVIVRATDGEGDLQPKKDHQPFPSGATGWVSKTINA